MKKNTANDVSREVSRDPIISPELMKRAIEKYGQGLSYSDEVKCLLKYLIEKQREGK